MAKKGRSTSFGPDILRLRMTNWPRILAIKTTVSLPDARLRSLERRLAAIESALKMPALRRTSANHLAAQLQEKWRLKS